MPQPPAVSTPRSRGRVMSDSPRTPRRGKNSLSVTMSPSPIPRGRLSQLSVSPMNPHRRAISPISTTRRSPSTGRRYTATDAMKTVKEVASENPDVEYLYLRENDFTKFDPWQPLECLKVLDLSLNDIANCDFLWDVSLTGAVECRLPNLRHLYLTGNSLTSLEGFSSLPLLETLTLSSNAIESFDGLGSLENLRVLSLHHNDVEDLRAFPYLPKLNSVNLLGNPIHSRSTYRKSLLSLCNLSSIMKIDNRIVTEEEKNDSFTVDNKVRFAIVEGFVPSQGDDWTAAAGQFIHDDQVEKSRNTNLHMLSVSCDSKGTGCIEGSEMKLSVCLRDGRDRETSLTKIYHSNHILPMEFRVSAPDASKVILKSDVTNWKAVHMAPDARAPGFYSVTLYVVPGTYYFKYVVDGVDIVDEPHAICGGQRYTSLVVPEPEPDEDDDDEIRECVLFIRWLRSTSNRTFETIPGAEGLTYTPTNDDISSSLRAEILCYDDGLFHSLVFDISSEVMPSHPEVTSLYFTSPAVENDELTLHSEYRGGIEQRSLVEWRRLSKKDDDTYSVIATKEPFKYTCTLEDVGRRIAAVYSPRRIDGVVGQPAMTISEPVLPRMPTASDAKFVTEAVEGRPLVVHFTYNGGYSGDHVYEWYRWDSMFNCYERDPTATAQSIIPQRPDVGQLIKVVITPVSSLGIRGEPMTLESPPVVACAPEISDLHFVNSQGELMTVFEEGQVLKVQFDYKGGEPGSHLMHWDGESAQDQPNSLAYLLEKIDIDKHVTVTVTPCRSDGQTGRPIHAKTPLIRAARPSVQLQVIGEAQETSTLQLTSSYIGGDEGDSVIVWCCHPDKNPPVLRSAWHTATPKANSYYIETGSVDKYISSKYTPVRSDGVRGNDVILTLGPVAHRDPGKIVITKVWIEGTKIGKSPEAGVKLYGRYSFESEHNVNYPHLLFQWLRSDGETVSKKSEFTPDESDIGHTIKFSVRSKASAQWHSSTSTAEIEGEQLRIQWPTPVVEYDILDEKLFNVDVTGGTFHWKFENSSTKGSRQSASSSSLPYQVPATEVGKKLWLTVLVPAKSFAGSDQTAQSSVVVHGCVKRVGIHIINPQSHNEDVDDTYWADDIVTCDIQAGYKLEAVHETNREVEVTYQWEYKYDDDDPWREYRNNDSDLFITTNPDIGRTIRLTVTPFRKVQGHSSPLMGTPTSAIIGKILRSKVNLQRMTSEYRSSINITPKRTASGRLDRAEDGTLVTPSKKSPSSSGRRMSSVPFLRRGSSAKPFGSDVQKSLENAALGDSIKIQRIASTDTMPTPRKEKEKQPAAAKVVKKEPTPPPSPTPPPQMPVEEAEEPSVALPSAEVVEEELDRMIKSQESFGNIDVVSSQWAVSGQLSQRTGTHGSFDEDLVDIEVNSEYGSTPSPTDKAASQEKLKDQRGSNLSVPLINSEPPSPSASMKKVTLVLPEEDEPDTHQPAIEQVGKTSVSSITSLDRPELENVTVLGRSLAATPPTPSLACEAAPDSPFPTQEADLH